MRNVRGIRAAVEHVRKGGALIVFLSGEFARRDEADWKPEIARLIALGRPAAVVPAYVRGCNSLPFQLASAVTPSLSSAMLVRELLNKRGRTVEVRLGRGVAAELLAAFETAGDRINYLRWRTEFSGRGIRPKCVRRHACLDNCVHNNPGHR
jgi:putative hemolysin